MPARSRRPLEITAIAVVSIAVIIVANGWWLQAGTDSDRPTVDFAHFYSLGFAAGHPAERAALKANDDWRSLIARLAPGRDQYPRVYGPHVALLFAPLAYLSLPAAYIVWNFLSLAAFAACVIWCVRVHARSLAPHHFWVTAGTLAFPPLVHLLVLGHAGVIGVVALTIMTAGLTRRSVWLAGLGLGLLSFKPTFFIPVLIVSVFGGEVMVAAVGLAVAGAALVATVPVLGYEPTTAYLASLIDLSRAPDVVAKPHIMCSLRTFWQFLLPPVSAAIAYAVSAGATLIAASWGWRRTTAPLQRAGLAGAAIVLATPHLYYYDLVVLAPGIIASAAWAVERRRRAGLVALTTLTTYLALFSAPLILVLPVNVPAIIHLVWFVVLLASWTRPDQSSRSAFEIGRRDARNAGNTPPTSPMASDQIKPRTSNVGVTRNANAT